MVKPGMRRKEKKAGKQKILEPPAGILRLYLWLILGENIKKTWEIADPLEFSPLLN